MVTVKNSDEIKAGTGLAVTVGFFDGVHLGHRYLIDGLKRIAKERNLASAIVTFNKHPRIVLNSAYQTKLLNSFDEKIEHLSTLGVDYCIVIDFTPEFAQIGAREFIVDVLAGQWNVKALLAGYDHRFGNGLSDGFDEYKMYGASCGMKVIEGERFNFEHKAVSSSEIRRLLGRGMVEEAARRLTYNYRIRGHVMEGRKIGRKIGCPTINIRLDDPLKTLPADGVYAVAVTMEGIVYGGMLYIGRRPTFSDGGDLMPEVNLFNFDGDAYGMEVSVEIIKHIRGDIMFNSIEELKQQLERDRQAVLSIIK